MPENTPTRRRLLAGLGGGLAAACSGCLGSERDGGSKGTEGSPPSRTPTGTLFPTPTPGSPTPPGVSTPAAGDCEPIRPSPATPAPGGLEPASYPELPDEPTDETAVSFALEFERAFATNAVVAGTSTANVPDGIGSLEFYDASAERRATGAGHLVEVSLSLTYQDEAGDETPDASGKTPSPAPTGHTGVTARYYVTGRFALRRPGGGGAWTVVACD